jgi:MoxR-like ATPase
VHDLRERVRAQVAKVVVGHGEVVDSLLSAVAVGGHVLLEGPPGTAKTLIARAFAAALGLRFTRAQFTPDMLPSDLTGTVTLRSGELAFRQGPVFTQVLLADEINRTPPKTQAALLEAMGERQVTVDGVTHPLPAPFLVVATQNPIEYEGTYPLPEAQLDRFLMKVQVGYPAPAEASAMLRLRRDGIDPATLVEVEPVTDSVELVDLRARVGSIHASDEVVKYVSDLVAETRRLPSVELGASPRAAVHLLAAARATAALAGRDFVVPDDVAGVAPDVLCHRLLMRPEAELERFGAADAVAAALAAVPVPR